MEIEKRHVEEIASLNMRTIEALALAIEAKDHTTHTHLQRVRTYAVEIAKEIGLSPDEIEALRAAALLHDIGKLAVPEHIINKPGRLTPEEFEKMKVHPLVGAEILDRVAFPYPVAPIVRSHHERWDGSGYPAGLAAKRFRSERESWRSWIAWTLSPQTASIGRRCRWIRPWIKVKERAEPGSIRRSWSFWSAAMWIWNSLRRRMKTASFLADFPRIFAWSVA